MVPEVAVAVATPVALLPRVKYQVAPAAIATAVNPKAAHTVQLRPRSCGSSAFPAGAGDVTGRNDSSVRVPVAPARSAPPPRAAALRLAASAMAASSTAAVFGPWTGT